MNEPLSYILGILNNNLSKKMENKLGGNFLKIYSLRSIYLFADNRTSNLLKPSANAHFSFGSLFWVKFSDLSTFITRGQQEQF